MSDQFFIYFSELLGKPLVDIDGRVAGIFYDFSIALNNDIYPRVKGIIFRSGFLSRRFAEVPISDVARIQGNIFLKVPLASIVFQDGKVEAEFAVRRDVLDQQIVDVENKKVERVNDVHFLRVENQFHIAHVDVGLRGLFRRLEWEPFVDAVVRFFKKNAEYLTHEELVSWKNAQVLTLGSQKNVLKLDVARAKIAKIPAVALAELMGDLDVFEQLSLFRTLAFDVQLKVFADMAQDDKTGLVGLLEDQEVSQIITHIPSDEAADFLMAIPKDRVQQLMRLMGSETSRRLRALLGFRKDSAGGLMTTEFLSLNKSATAGDALAKVKASVDHAVSITTLYVVDDDGRYLGTTTIHRFINEDPGKSVLGTCYPHRVFVHTDDGMEKVAVLIEQYKYSAIPVLDDHNVLVGSITVDDVMEELIALAWGKYKDQL